MTAARKRRPTAGPSATEVLGLCETSAKPTRVGDRWRTGLAWALADRTGRSVESCRTTISRARAAEDPTAALMRQLCDAAGLRIQMVDPDGHRRPLSEAWDRQRWSDLLTLAAELRERVEVSP